MMDPRTAEENEPRRPINPRMQQPYKFTPEELKVLRECGKESFFQRCLPLGALLGFGTYYGVKTGYFTPNVRYGATPKVAAAVIVGYFLGKFSYQGKCAEKLMQLPNSQVGEMLRRRRKGTWQESLDPSFGPGMSLAPFSGVSSTEIYTDLTPDGALSTNTLDMDTSRPQNDGLDDSRRPTLDNPVYEEEEMPPVQKHVTTYEELRKQNREEYHQKRTANYPSSGSGDGSRQGPSVAVHPSRPEPPPGPIVGPRAPPLDGHRNKYGDVWE